ncbi:MAG TPA: fused MFS/spermidine synthase [Candidatus Binatia bacterium]|nr:fused MFS/spermidine synthase [Candidatus Binatia bacterium]
MSRFKYAVYSLFLISGISGLVYEIVWLRMLSRIMGVTIYATSTVLASFMAGLALGSFLFGRLADRRTDWLKVYAALELGIGCTALLIPVVLSVSLSLYRSIHQLFPATGEGLAISALIRAPISFAALIIPTTLMGGTLPVLTAYLAKRENLFGKNFSLLYGLNTLGAVAGVFVSGFITLGILGERRTVLLGVIINFGVAFCAYWLYRKERPTASPSALVKGPPSEDRPVSPYPSRIRSMILVAFAASGFTALAYEIIWTRQLILWLKTSIYAFSGMLCVFLVGTALGSILMNRVVDRLKRPLTWFGGLELGIALMSVINLLLFSHLGHGGFGSAVSFAGLGNAVFSTVVVVFPLTLLFGMIFPIAGRCYVKTIHQTGSSVGWLYSANTVGSLLGSLCAGFWLIPALGCTHTVLVLTVVNVALGALLLYLEPEGHGARWVAWAAACGVLLIGYAAAGGRDPFFEAIRYRIYGGDLARRDCTIFFHKEGVEGTVTSFEAGGNKRLWINGVGMTALATETKLMAHLPLLFTKEPKEALIICFGMGTTLRSASMYPQLHVTAVELVPEVFQTFRFYHSDAETVLKEPNVTTVAADGRNYVLLSEKKYDLITIDPAPPIFSAGTVNLYTREFLTLCRDHLAPQGIMCLWIPGRTKREIESFLKTFHTVFPNTSVWSGVHGLGFYLLGTTKPARWDLFEQNANSLFQNSALVEDLGQFDHDCVTLDQLRRLKLWSDEQIDKVSSDGVLITDDFPFTEFPLWRYLFVDRSRWVPEEVKARLKVSQENGPGSSF